MAIGTPTELAFAQDAAGADTSVTTGTFTPTAGAMLIAVAMHNANTGSATTITDTLGDVGPWNDITFVSQTAGGTVGVHAAYAIVGTSPTIGDVTFAAASAQAWSCSIIEITGANKHLPPPTPATVANQNSTATATLPAIPGESSVCLGFLGSRDLTPTVDADYTEFVDRLNGTGSRVLSCCYDLTPTDAVCAWTALTALFCNAGILVEIRPINTWMPRVIMSS